MRLNKYIGLSGVYSRRKADELISLGLVKVNGELVKEMGFILDLDKNPDIEINGQKIVLNEKKTYLIFNKPVGYTCTKRQFDNERNIYDLLPGNYANLNYAGRLDKDSSGLLLLTNDGDLIQRITHPSQECLKTYLVEIRGHITENETKELSTGIILDGQKTKKAKITILGESAKKSRLKIEISEGRNRQIRRMFDIIGHRVIQLHRTGIGPIKLPDNLKSGCYEEFHLTPQMCF